jgi:hypothetical protein
MKRIFLLSACVIAINCNAQDCKPSKGDAVVEQRQGLYIFNDCKPKSEYIFLGEVTHGNSFTKADGDTPLDQKKDGLAKKARKEFPEAEGIILHLSPDAKDRADVIKFK